MYFISKFLLRTIRNCKSQFFQTVFGTDVFQRNVIPLMIFYRSFLKIHFVSWKKLCQIWICCISSNLNNPQKLVSPWIFQNRRLQRNLMYQINVIFGKSTETAVERPTARNVTNYVETKFYSEPFISDQLVLSLSLSSLWLVAFSYSKQNCCHVNTNTHRSIRVWRNQQKKINLIYGLLVSIKYIIG